MAVYKLTSENFDSVISEGTALVDFWASWCGPCRMVGPVIERIADKLPDVKVCKVNVDDEPALAARFGIMSIPTVIAFKNGAQTAKKVGVSSEADYISMTE